MSDTHQETQQSPPSGLKSLILMAIRHPLFKIVMAASIIFYLIKTDRFKLEEFASLEERWHYLALGCLLILPGFAISAIRFQLLLKGQGLRCSFRQALSWTMIGAFWDIAMPGATGGDLVKIFYVARHFGPGQRGVAGTSVLVDRIVGMLGLFFLGFIVCLLGWSTIWREPKLRFVPLVLFVICAGATFGFALFSSRKWQESPRRKRLMGKLPWHESIEKIYLNLAGFREKKVWLLIILLLSLLNHAVWCFAVLSFSLALRIDADPYLQLVVLPLGLFLNVFGVAGGVGTGEMAFEYLFSSLLGTPKGQGFALAAVFHILGAVMRILCGLPFFLAYRQFARPDVDGQDKPDPASVTEI